MVGADACVRGLPDELPCPPDCSLVVQGDWRTCCEQILWSCALRVVAQLFWSVQHPVYLYFFDHILEIIKLFVPFKGCCHGSELPFVFDFHPAFLGKGELPLAEQFVRYWTRFASTWWLRSAVRAWEGAVAHPVLCSQRPVTPTAAPTPCGLRTRKPRT